MPLPTTVPNLTLNPQLAGVRGEGACAAVDCRCRRVPQIVLTWGAPSSRGVARLRLERTAVGVVYESQQRCKLVLGLRERRNDLPLRHPRLSLETAL